MLVALFGGTFNPVHNGHLKLANQVRKQFSCSKIIFVPSYIPAHKNISQNIEAQERLIMLELAIKNLPWAEVSDCEIKRRGVSYTIDTLKYLIAKYSMKEKPGLIVGDDLVADFNKWKDPEEIKDLAHIIVAHRLFRNKIPISFEHSYLENAIYKLSSTDVRKLRNEKLDLSSYLPKSVLDYILKKGFYLNEN